MTRRRVAVRLGLVCLLVHGAPAHGLIAGGQSRVADAKPGDVRVLATAAIRTPLEAIRAEAQQSVGRPLVIEYGSARGNLKDRILSGQEFEVAILVPDANEELERGGKVTADRFDIARVEPSIGERGDGPLVDVSTSATLKEALLKAKWLWWSPTGTSSPTVNLGIGGGSFGLGHVSLLAASGARRGASPQGVMIVRLPSSGRRRTARTPA